MLVDAAVWLVEFLIAGELPYLWGVVLVSGVRTSWYYGYPERLG